MRKSILLLAVAAAGLGFGWRFDNAEKMRKIENIESVTSAYVAEHVGTKDFFVLSLDNANAPEKAVVFTLEQMSAKDARERLKDVGITSDAEIILTGGTPAEQDAAVKRLMTVLNWNSLSIKKLVEK